MQSRTGSSTGILDAGNRKFG